MIEPFPGSGSSVWTGIPAPAFGWFQPTPSIGSRTTGMASTGFAAPPPPFAGPGPVSQALNGINAVAADPFGYAAVGVPGIIPALAGPDVANGPTGRGLVAAVAMRRGQPMGPTNEQEIEDFIYDALDMLLGANEVEVRFDGGRVTLTGSVAHKRLKRDVGEIAWATPGIADVHNNVAIVGRRRSRVARETEPQSAPAGRKQG
jgi:hypothetical protein